MAVRVPLVLIDERKGDTLGIIKTYSGTVAPLPTGDSILGAGLIDHGMPLVFTYYGGFAAGQTSIEIYDENGIYLRQTMPDDGSLIGASLYTSSPRTAGTLLAKPEINGIPVVPTSLDCTLNAVNATFASNIIASGVPGFTFNALDTVGVRFTSDAGWLPVTSDLLYVLYVILG